MPCSTLKVLFCPLAEGHLLNIVKQFDYPRLFKRGRPVKTKTSSRVGQNSPHFVTKVCDSMLHWEIRNCMPSGLLRTAMPFDRFRAFMISICVILFEKSGFADKRITNSRKWYCSETWTGTSIHPTNCSPFNPHPQNKPRINKNTLTFLMVHKWSLILRVALSPDESKDCSKGIWASAQFLFHHFLGVDLHYCALRPSMPTGGYRISPWS